MRNKMKEFGNKNISYVKYDTKNPIDVAWSIKDEMEHEGRWTIFNLDIIENFNDYNLFNDKGKIVYQYLDLMMRESIATNKGAPKSEYGKITNYINWLEKYNKPVSEQLIKEKLLWEKNNKGE